MMQANDLWKVRAAEVTLPIGPDIAAAVGLIIDDSIVVMGSFNFSNNAANDNDENTLIIYNSDIASAYLEEFQRRWAESEVVPASDLDC